MSVLKIWIETFFKTLRVFLIFLLVININEYFSRRLLRRDFQHCVSNCKCLTMLETLATWSWSTSPRRAYLNSFISLALCTWTSLFDSGHWDSHCKTFILSFFPHSCFAVQAYWTSRWKLYSCLKSAPHGRLGFGLKYLDTEQNSAILYHADAWWSAGGYLQ